jgi:cation transport ATPase
LGDGHNDREAMSCADVAIAVGLLPSTPAASLIGVAHHVFHDEDTLCRFLEALAHQ